jgi:chromosome partitioning protein
MRVIAVVNQKGGVGKTAVTANLAALAGEAGARVLAVDADPQYALTRQLLDVETAASRPLGLAQVLRQEQRLQDVVVRSTSAPVDLIPSSRDLADAEIGLVAATRREERLARAFVGAGELWDLVLIDSPPNLGLLTVNALAACDEVVIPVSAEDEGAVRGVLEVLLTIAEVYGDDERPPVSLVVTKWDKTRETAQAVEDAVEQLADRVRLLPKIPSRALHHKAPVLRQPAVLIKGKKGERDAVAKAYGKLARELGIKESV